MRLTLKEQNWKEEKKKEEEKLKRMKMGGITARSDVEGAMNWDILLVNRMILHTSLPNI